MKAFISNIHARLLLTSASVFLLLSGLLFYVNGGLAAATEHSAPLVVKAVFLLVQVTGLLYINYYVLKFSDQRFTANRLTVKKLCVEVCACIIGSFLFIQLVTGIYGFIAHTGKEALNITQNRLWQIQGISLIFSLLIYATLTIFRMFVNIRNHQFRITQWENEYTRASYEALKNQLNPHFLFNSLSVLSSLVYTDKKEAAAFIHKLSRTYRYLLEQRDQQFVALEKELQFLEHYCFLVQRRFGEKLRIEAAVSTDASRKVLVPHSLLIVLEYLIGSSRMSAQRPLSILITNEDDYLTIRHNAEPKPMGNEGLAPQWESLRQRYAAMKHSILLEVDAMTSDKLIRLPLIADHETR